jgi:outer membrane biosynthesis protein TonB
MKTLITITLFTLACATLGGCAARNAEMYRDDTRKLLETKTGSIRDCYNAELKKDRTATAKVVVRFKVSSDTGKITNAKVDETQTTGTKTLGACVVKAIEGLKLDPKDAREGDATFTWEFQAKS